MSTFIKHDPTTPDFWTERFTQHFTPWDHAGVPAALQQFVTRESAARTALIPGCGAGYEVAYLSNAGWDVAAIDFSAAAIATAQATLGAWSARVSEADFFSFKPDKPIDVIYERAFLCALPRSKWPQIAVRWAELLARDGLLIGFFYFDSAAKGPPFGISTEALNELLTSCFELIEDQPVHDSVQIFAGKERWQVWRRI